jgi:hypothetical protein
MLILSVCLEFELFLLFWAFLSSSFQNQGRRFVSGLASKHSDGFRRFGLKTGGDGF